MKRKKKNPEEEIKRLKIYAESQVHLAPMMHTLDLWQKTTRQSCMLPVLTLQTFRHTLEKNPQSSAPPPLPPGGESDPATAPPANQHNRPVLSEDSDHHTPDPNGGHGTSFKLEDHVQARSEDPVLDIYSDRPPSRTWRQIRPVPRHKTTWQSLVGNIALEVTKDLLFTWRNIEINGTYRIYSIEHRP